MLRILFTLISIAFLFHSSAQQIHVEVGRVSTVFDYEDSDGAGIENLHPSSHFSYAASYRKPFSNRAFWTAGISFNRYGMIGSDPLYDNEYVWDVKYLGPALGVELEAFKKKNLHIYGRIGAEPQFMIGGTQQINNQIFELKGVEQFDKPFLFLKGGAGANYCADGMVAVSLRYMYGKGLPLGNSGDEESLRLNTHTVTVGLLISLKYCSYCFKKHFDSKK